LSAKQRFHNRLVDREMENVPHQRRSHVRQLYLEAFEQAKDYVSTKQAVPWLPCDLNYRVLQFLGASAAKWTPLKTS